MPHAAVGKPQSSLAKSAPVEPIQLPLSYKYKPLDSSDIKLDFTFDEELAKLSDDAHLAARRPVELQGDQLPSLSVDASASASGRNSISSATEANALNIKIAKTKKVWDEFDHG